MSLANWAEFYVCAEDFNKAISLAEGVTQSARDYKSDLKCIKKLAQLLKEKKRINPQEVQKLAVDWGKSSWFFKELLMFRECSIRDGKNFGNLLDVIEKFIQFQELNEICTQGVGLFKRGSRFRSPYVRVKLSVE